MLADVGLVGFPNAGKSTLVSTLSAAKPKVADYPFTTLVPSLGVVSVAEYKSFVIADIPGIIEGAHEGKGLGIQFLKHIERNAVLLFMIPADSEDHKRDYETLKHELHEFNERVLQKPIIIGICKIDLVAPSERPQFESDLIDQFPSDVPIHFFSSATRVGLEE